MNFKLLVEQILEETDKSKMPANKPRRIRKGEPGYGKKKFVVKAKEGDKERVVRFGDANLKIKKNIPARRRSYRARHHCENPGSKLKANYWSCRNW